MGQGQGRPGVVAAMLGLLQGLGHQYVSWGWLVAGVLQFVYQRKARTWREFAMVVGIMWSVALIFALLSTIKVTS